MELLQCSKCKKWLCPTDFYPVTKRKRGRAYDCIRCHATRLTQHRTANKTKNTPGIDLEALEDRCCLHCEQWKPARDFHVDLSTAQGIRNVCKDCWRLKSNAYKSRRRMHKPGTRCCRCCQIEKPLSDFRKSCYEQDGYEITCKACIALARTATDRPLYTGPTLVCRHCETAKPREAFSDDSRNKYTGKQDWCKACAKRYKGPWRKENAEEIRQYNHEYDAIHKEEKSARSSKRRAILAGAKRVETVTVKAVYQRDKGICQICHERVPPKLRPPHPESASRDHVIPVSKGGDHSFQNIVLAHLKCNVEKGNRPVTQQQRLF